MIRVDGDVRRINVEPLEHRQVHDMVYDIMSDAQRKMYEETLECDFSFEIQGLARFRVNAFNQNRGAGAVFRTIPSKILTLEQLNCPKVFGDLAMKPRGMVLVTGPTGSGKSTTLAAMIDYINKNEYGHILTVEDPIEFVHTSQKCLINQREVHRDTHGFNEALRSALREDPDIILVGELRDLETIRLALTAAETGHLVFGTLHTSSAAKTIDRIIDVFPGEEKEMIRAMLSESLQAVISQTLCKTKDGNGRLAAHEIMVGTPAIRNLIREDKVAQMYSAIQTGQGSGMQTLDQNLTELVRRNMITPAEAQEEPDRRPRGAPAHRTGPRHGTRSGHQVHQRSAAPDGVAQGVGPLPDGGVPARVKVDGKVTKVSPQPLTGQHTLQLARAIMNDRQTAEFERTKECNFAISPTGIGRFRVNAYIQQGHVALVLRTIPQTLPTIESLDLPPILKDVVQTKRGLVILVGATGSGKSTTLAAMVDHRNETTYGHIITIEDPVEFVHPHKNCIVSQREVGLDTEGWEQALKNAMREAPDVILIGEIRDRETMEHAVAFAETGHLCMATLHANNANQAMDRIVNFFPEDRRNQLLMDLSLNLKALVSQRLLPRQEGKGRVAAVEIMLNTPLISDLIFKGEVGEIKEIMKRSRELGMKTFDQALFDLYEFGRVTYEDALRNADSVNDLRLQIKLNSERARSGDLSSGTEHLTIV
ncbi:type II/IV secretion system protein [Ditylenchus destructor]|nr:type II/IV secretion system protein [Ditylenchus destructor]